MQDKLNQEWSPEQISGWLRLSFPDRPGWHLCHETIYQALYYGGAGGLSRELTARLRTGRPLRRRRRRADQRRVRFVVESKLIDQRPPEVEQRLRFGDWEGDLIIGRGSRSAIGTIVERRSGLLRLIHLPDGHGPDKLRRSIVPVLEALPDGMRRSLTWDQGTEMARHDQFAHLFDDLSVHTVADLARVEQRLNTRPRKRLSWRTPLQVLDGSTGRTPDTTLDDYIWHPR